ncbi:hypothetical protein UPYG_G00091200 [Umbra pygmaea]|uniref:Ig-like domain-containing protein n=1 Tax=Umbra pygmaea TaxID=75934 RepID=A0ABD0XFT5_UMBPY
MIFLIVPTAGSKDFKFDVTVQPEVVALAGGDVILPCYMEPNISAVKMKVLWSRIEHTSSVPLYEDHDDKDEQQNVTYRGRTSLLKKDLEQGNVSLKLSQVKVSDEGRYRCSVIAPSWNAEATITLTVKGEGFKPQISNPNPKDEGLPLKCNSTGWYPKPEMTWLDSEGRNLSSDSEHGPTFSYTVVDGLYTVIGEVVVKEKENNQYVCRIHLQRYNLTRETEINISKTMFPKSAGIGELLFRWLFHPSYLIDLVVVLAVVVVFLAVFQCRYKRKYFKQLECLMKQIAFVNQRMPLTYNQLTVNRVIITLDPDTAHPHLRVDGEQVSYIGSDSQPEDVSYYAGESWGVCGL